MRDVTQRGRALMRVIELATRDIRAQLEGLAEWVQVSSFAGGADSVGTATTDENESARVIENYGFASRPPGSAVGLAVAVGADEQERAIIGVIAPTGRPVTAVGDVALWSSAGHLVVLDNDGSITVTSKDGATMEMDAAGAIVQTAGTGASITLNVDVGASVNAGDGSAVALLKAQATETFLAAAANGITSIDPNVEAAFTAFGAALAGLANSAGTTKAKGT